jgi:enterobactin synthetase component D
VSFPPNLYATTIFRQPPKSTSSQVFPLDNRIAQRVILLSDLAQREVLSREGRTRNEQFGIRKLFFDTGRACAADVLTDLGSYETSVPMAADRSPVWPKGYVGSITHTDDFVGVAVARCKDFRSIGIDAETIMPLETMVEIDDLCMNKRELGLSNSVGINRQTFSSLCFSAKESFFKCIYPLTRVLFDFLDVEVVCLDATRQLLKIRLLRDLPGGFRKDQIFTGTFSCSVRRVYTAFVLNEDSTCKLF